MELDILDVTHETPFEAPIIVIFGVDGIGKTQLADEFPNAIYLPTPGEKKPAGATMAQPRGKDGEPLVIRDFVQMVDALDQLATRNHKFDTVVIDAIDGLEPMVWDETCYRLNIRSIEAAGYGKGYAEADREWLEFFGLLEEIRARGVTIILIMHPEIKQFNSPTSEPYDRYQPRLHKRANAIIQSKSDVICFMDYRISVHSTEVSRGNKVSHAEGAKERIMNFKQGAAFIAKNRYGMPDSKPFKLGQGFDVFREHIDFLSKKFPVKEKSRK